MSVNPNTNSSPTALLDEMRQQWGGNVNKYTPAAASKEQQQKWCDDICAGLDNAWKLIQNPPAVYTPSNNATTPEEIKAQEEAQAKNAGAWNKHNAAVSANRYYTRVQQEYEKILAATENVTDDKVRQTTINSTMALKLEELKKGAIQSAFSETGTVLRPADVPAFKLPVDQMRSNATDTFIASMLGGSSIGGAAAAAKDGVIGAILGNIVQWVRGMGKELFMYTGNAEQVKSIVSGWHPLLGGEGKKKSVDESLAELQDQQVRLRLMKNGYIAQPPSQQPAAQGAAPQAPQNSSAGISYPNGMVPQGSPFPGAQPPVIPQGGRSYV